MANQYLTVAEFARAVDTRVLAMLGSDTDSAGTVNQSNAILTTAIQRASADIEADATRGEMYSPTTLLALYDADDWLIRSICAQRALWHLYARRAKSIPDSIQAGIDEAMRYLEDLREGRRVFAVDENRSAGVPSINVINASERVMLNLEGNSRFYPPVNTEVV